MLQFDAKSLLQQARKAAETAYAPYSNEPQGAALLAADGTVYTCGNVEFATFGGSVCADLGALTKAVTDGKRQFVALAVFPYRYPCGNCRQFISEFGLELQIVAETPDGNVENKALPQLLPNSFGKSNLG